MDWGHTVPHGQRDFGQERVLQSVEEVTWERTGRAWRGGRHFSGRLEGPVFSGEVSRLKLSWRVMIGVC